MSAIDRRLGKLEEAHAPPPTPAIWTRVIANSRAHADQIVAEWDAAAERLRENLIIRVIMTSNDVPEVANEGMMQ